MRNLSVEQYYRAVFKYHPVWGYWYRENIHCRIPSQGTKTVYYTVETNSCGARTTNEINEIIKTDSKKIMFVGCSYTAGDGVDNAERFSDLLETSENNLTCYNFALSGSGNDQQFLIHDHFAPLINPDILVLSPYIGCLGRNILTQRPAHDPMTGVTVMRPKPYFKIIDGKLRLFHSPVPKRALEFPLASQATKDTLFHQSKRKIGEFLRNTLKNLNPTQEATKELPLNHLYSNTSGECYILGMKILEEILKCSKAKKKIVMPLPTYRDVLSPELSSYRPFYKQLAQDNGAIFVDCMDDFVNEGRDKVDALFFPGDGHLTKLGHQIVANCLSKFM